MVQLHQPRMHRAAFEVYRNRLKDIGAKFFPSPRFGEDAMTKRARVVAAFVSVVNFASIRKPRASRSKATITNLTTDNIHFTMDSSDRVLQTPRPETAL